MLRRMLTTARTTRARVIARLAGVPAGLRQTRRGSFLIMVVGTLALLSVITVIYISIGRSDRQTGAAALKYDQRRDEPTGVRDYLAGVIADDVFDWLYLGERDAADRPIYRRETWDYPSAPYNATVPNGAADITNPITVGQGADERFHFTPTGNGTGTDPWLRSPEPVLLDFNFTSNYATDPAAYFRDRLDWMNLSNFAPDGAFVNLFNLRGRTRNGFSVGNFDATPWEMRGDNLDADSAGAKLTLFAGPPETDGQRNGARDFGGQPTDPSGKTAVPAEWGARQRWSVFPAVEPRSQITPGSPDYLLYQYADADGDGIVDARWIELVEDRDPDDGIAPRYIMAPDSRMRYFIAASAIDLSGRVNINTATDSSLAPVAADPFGLTPSAIDVRRLLTGEDFFTDQRTDWDSNPGNGFGLGYEWSIQPNHPKPPGVEDPSNYEDYFTSLTDAVYNGYLTGEKAYDALRMVLDTGVTPGPGYAGLDFLADGTYDEPDPQIEREFSLAAGGGTLNPYWASYWKLNGGPFAPTDYYTLFAGYGAGGAGLGSGGSLNSGLGRPFGMDSLFELLTFNGVNDDSRLSPMEVILDGRGPSSMGDLARRFGPLRDNRRTADVERLRGGWVNKNYQFYDEAKAAMYTDIRQRLTTISLVRPITPERLNADTSDPNKPLAADLKLTDSDTKSRPADLCSSSSSLFKFYADTLAPDSYHQQGSALGDHWDPADSLYNEFRTLYYGYRGPHLALRTAAHLAVNMLDAYDSGEIPTKRTVLLNGSPNFRDSNNLYGDDPGDRPAEYPWRLLDLDGVSVNGPYPANPRLYASDPMPDPAAMPDAINVFGIEAQPFIVEAASFVMYTDTPEDLGGDDDTGEAMLNGQRVFRLKPSIDGRFPEMGLAQDNPDFLFEVLAFQIHNPFDETITLSGSGGNITEAQQDLYYIQYGTQYFKLTDVSDGAEQPITIGPRDSKTVYALSQHTDIIARRVYRITKDAAYGNDDGSWTLERERSRIEDWIKHQLGDEAVQIAPFEPTTGVVDIPPDRVLDLRQTEDLQRGTRDDRHTVRLWRVERPEFDTANGGYPISGVDEQTVNVPDNDTLVDRLRDPLPAGERPTLDRRLWESTDATDSQEGQKGAIGGSVKRGPEPPDPDADGKDNRGLSITRYSVLRRNGDRQAGQLTTPPRGGLPAYCLELKQQLDASGVALPAANDIDDDGSASKDLTKSDFSGVEGDDTLDDLLDKQSGGTQGNGMGLGDRLVPTISTDPAKKADDPKFGIVIKKIPANLDGVAFDDLRPEAHLNNDRFEDNGVSVMRVADMLLPLGIGPYQIPDPAFNGGNENVEWTTLSEALATALHYEDDTAATNVYAGAFVPPAGPGSPDTVLLDRGQLRYDWFVPFRDADTDGVYDIGETTWGLGVPLAATIFDRITTLDRKFASLNAPTHGLLNINTASRETLRSVPGLSPPSNTNAYDSSGNWWWTDGDHDWRSDIATTLAAYRDRVSMYPRDVTGAEPPDQPIDFRRRWDFAGGSRLEPLPGFAPGAYPGDNARWGSTGIAGLREQTGLRSLGEVTFLRDWDYPVSPNGGYFYPHDIDRLGFDTANTEAEGVDSLSYDYNEDGTKTDDDEIIDDYDERLALANAVMASSSVRSDVFAVWFLIHGYQESDVKGLADQDPMVPSVARRFVMVVDRSNVTAPGDKPKILLFKEVPL